MHFYMYAIFRVFPMRQSLSTTEKGQQNGGGESALERRPDQPPLGPGGGLINRHLGRLALILLPWTAYGIRLHLLKLGDSGQQIPFVLNCSIRLQAPKWHQLLGFAAIIASKGQFQGYLLFIFFKLSFVIFLNIK
jgi:hypothetical protein